MNVLTYVHLRNIYRSTGVGRVARELTEQLARRPDVTLKVLADRGDHGRIIDKVGAPWTDFDYCLFDKDTSRQQMIWYALGRPKAEDYWPEAQIVYCTAESYVPVRRAKLAVASHDMQLFEPEAHARNRWVLQQRLKWKLLFGTLERKADLFHAISGFSADRMAHYYPSIRERIRVIPNAVSESFFRPPSELGRKLLSELGIADRPYLLVPGGLHYRKNADLILQVWPQIQAALPDLTLVIANHNADEYLERARALPGVVIAGFQEEPQLVALYNGAQVVWFPSRYEGFGMPVLEAMACGAPVVTSSTSALPEVAGGAAAALVHPDQPKEHIDAIVGLFGDSAARARASALGRARAAEFTWERSAQKLMNAFEEVLGGSSSRRID